MSAFQTKEEITPPTEPNVQAAEKTRNVESEQL